MTDLYVCPTCRGPLELAGDDTGGSGRLTCAGGHSFAVEAGLPRFVADEGYSASFGLQWSTFHSQQIDSLNGSSITQDRFFRGTGWPREMSGERILEAGCGSGRFTEVLLSTGAEVVSFDYSRAADVTHRSYGDRASVCQASIYEMPYRKGSFDRVFCYGVLQHTPDVRASFFALTEMLKPGGTLAVDVYEKWKVLFNARYRVRWLTRRLDKKRLLDWCKVVVPIYMKLTPPLYPWNQLLVPIKDYRGVLRGLSREQEIEMSVVDTMDALSPEFDQPQSMRTMMRWCREAGLRDVEARRGGNGIEIRARAPG